MPASVYVPSPLESLPNDTGSVRDEQVSMHARPAEDDSKLRTVDGLVRQRALLYPYEHVVSYPSSGTNYVDYTIQQLDLFAWRTAKHYMSKLPVRTSSAQKPTVVALLGASNLEYLITMLALNKLGHTTLLLSTRIPQVAIESLINTTGATTILADGRFLEMASKVEKSIATLQSGEIAGRSVFEFSIEAHGDTQLDSALDPEVEADNFAWIIHSSGMLPHLSLSRRRSNRPRLDWSSQAYLSDPTVLSAQLCHVHEHEIIHHPSPIS